MRILMVKLTCTNCRHTIDRELDVDKLLAAGVINYSEPVNCDCGIVYTTNISIPSEIKLGKNIIEK